MESEYFKLECVLDLNEKYIGDSGLENLISKNSCLADVTTFILRKNELGDEGIKSLCKNSFKNLQVFQKTSLEMME